MIEEGLDELGSSSEPNGGCSQFGFEIRDVIGTEIG